MSVRTGAVWLSPRHRPNRSWRTGTSGPRRARCCRPNRFCTRSGVGVRPMPTPATWRARRRLRSIPATPEVLDHYRGVLADEPGGELVQAVAAGVGDSGVEFHDSGLGVAPPLRGHLSRALVGADTAGVLAPQATQLRGGYLQVARVGG